MPAAVQDPTFVVLAVASGALALVVGIRFGAQAAVAGRRSGADERRRWAALVISGLAVACFGLANAAAGVGGFGGLPVTGRDALLLIAAVGLAVGMRSFHRGAVPRGVVGRSVPRLESVAVVALGATAVVGLVVPDGLPALAVAGGDPAIATAVEGWTDFVVAGVRVVGLAVGGVGALAGVRGLAATRVSGTLVDSLLRHLLPVQAFLALVMGAGLVAQAGVAPTVATVVRELFLVVAVTVLAVAGATLRTHVAMR